MPLSTFDGEPQEQVHEHYDAEGNATGTTVVTIPGWSIEDQAWALALQLREAAQCPRGHDLSESLAADSNEFLWQPNPPIVCKACVGLEQSVKASEKHEHRRSMVHSVKKVSKPKPRKRR